MAADEHTLKSCPRCNRSLPARDFLPDQSKKTGLSSYCRECNRAACSQRYQRDPGPYKEARAKWLADNPGKQAEMARVWYQANRELTLERAAARYAADPVGENLKKEARRRRRMAEQPDVVRRENREAARRRRASSLQVKVHANMSCRIWWALKKRGAKKSGKWLTGVDYTVSQLIEHLATTMPPGYSWADYAAGRLHIDHVHPVAAHDFASQDDVGFRACWALDNLQLLPATENHRKGARTDWQTAASVQIPTVDAAPTAP